MKISDQINLDSNKSLGPDNITVATVKAHHMAFSNILTDIFNEIIETGAYPDALKLARVTPFFKSGDRSNVSNYRPISTLSILNKVIEILLVARVSEYLTRYDLISPRQYGFRKGCSTLTATTELLEDVYDDLDNQTGMVWDRRLITTGVPQENNLGPLMFLVFINDLQLMNLHGKVRLFADDTLISYSNANPLQIVEWIGNYLDALQEYFNCNLLSLNLSKTSYMLFHSGRRCIPQLPSISEIISSSTAPATVNKGSGEVWMTGKMPSKGPIACPDLPGSYPSAAHQLVNEKNCENTGGADIKGCSAAMENDNQSPQENPGQDYGQNHVVLVQPVAPFNPAAYNFPQLRFRHLPTSEVRNAWTSWIRGFERIMVASGISEPITKKIQLLAMGGLELQSVFDSIPGADVDLEGVDAYQVAKDKLNNHFAPKHHDSFERNLFWTTKKSDDEPIEKFLTRIQQISEKCYFGNSILESRQIAVMDKIIQTASSDLREKLLERQNLNLDTCCKIVNTYQAVKYQAAHMNQPGPSYSFASPDVNKVYGRTSQQKPPFKNCSRCGNESHKFEGNCPALGRTCKRCGGLDHFRQVCRSKVFKPRNTNDNRPWKRSYPTNHGTQSVFKRSSNVMKVETDEYDEPCNKFSKNINPEQTSESEEELPVYNVEETDDDLIKCIVGGVAIEILIDSGSKYNLIDDTTWEVMKLQNVTVSNIRFDNKKNFRAYGKVPLRLITVFDASIRIIGTQQINSTFYVIEKGQQPLLGKITAQQLGVLRVGLPDRINSVEVPKQAFPCIGGIELTLPIDRSVAPVIQPLRRCPVPLLEKVKEKLDDLLERDIIERVEKPTSWVSPLVPILKDNGEIRLCVDMRRSNQAIQRLNHPLPVFEEILPRIRKAQYFSLLDLKESYYHVMLTENSRDITTFITNWGLYRFKRLFFGVNCAPELFQNLMESLLSSCKNMVNFIDDFLVFGETEREHDDALKLLVRKFEELGVQLNHHKCKYKQQEVVFLGHKLSGKGVLPSSDKVESILKCRAPKTKEELRSFLGLVTFVSRFIPNLATVNYPLRQLIKNTINFDWKSEHHQAFEQIKARIDSLDYLGYFDPKDRTLLVTDASGVGLGAVLIQFSGDRPRVISYASKSLTETEKRYASIEKEALAIVWAVERYKA
ncbi:uncharacterized protein LOC129742110 [Uranotaenia lowii]|uniref:uncharacterized protein LOC129742110 n=1 Tax=Uranotaenia lowii TaxID=190385 RepID=UPI0024791760|nr:uncharacterized protein LOC129742110 [Uranotaenia lowii]